MFWWFWFWKWVIDCTAQLSWKWTESYHHIMQCIVLRSWFLYSLFWNNLNIIVEGWQCLTNLLIVLVEKQPFYFYRAAFWAQQFNDQVIYFILYFSRFIKLFIILNSLLFVKVINSLLLTDNFIFLFNQIIFWYFNFTFLLNYFIF